MKKIIFLLFAMITFASIAPTSKAHAQANFTYTASNPTGAFTNTALDTMYYTTAQSYGVVTIQPIFTRLTGTMAGTAVLYYSVGGSTYYPTGDTLTMSNAATNTTVWNKASAARYWRIIRSGATTVTGTSAAKISGGGN
jgi:hypothetical protein